MDRHSVIPMFVPIWTKAGTCSSEFLGLESCLKQLKRFLLILPIWWIVSGGGCQSESLVGLVDHVQDGDSFVISRESHPIYIRLNGVDCPELNQPYGLKAKQLTRELVEGQRIRIMVRSVDGYGRLVADVFLEDGSSLGDHLLENGLAWWYRYYAPENKQFWKKEMKARESRLGLWEAANPVPPWKWRRRHG